MAKTRWQISRGEEPDAIYESAKGRRFAPEDWINLPLLARGRFGLSYQLRKRPVMTGD
jgi:hypothetical protein